MLHLTRALVLFAVPTALVSSPARAEPPTEPAPESDPADLGWDETDDVDTPVAAPTPAPTGPTPEQIAAAEEEEKELQWRRKKYQQARGTMISGWTTLAVAYGASVLVGAIAIDLGRDQDDQRRVRYGTRMFIPFGGPIAAAFESRSVTWGLLTAGASAAQIVGLSLGITGTLRMRKYPNPDEPQLGAVVLPSRRGAAAALTLRF